MLKTAINFFWFALFYWNLPLYVFLKKQIKKKLLTSTPCHRHPCLIMVAFVKERFGVKKVHYRLKTFVFYQLICGICFFSNNLPLCPIGFCLANMPSFGSNFILFIFTSKMILIHCRKLIFYLSGLWQYLICDVDDQSTFLFWYFHENIHRYFCLFKKTNVKSLINPYTHIHLINSEIIFTFRFSLVVPTSIFIAFPTIFII